MQTHTSNVTILFLILAQIWNPLGNITYWLAGSTVALPWTITYRKFDIVSSTLSFTKYGSKSSTTLARSFRGENLVSINSSYNIEGQAKLVFQNGNRGHNGTYSLDVSLKDGARGTKTVTSKISVIILGKTEKLYTLRFLEKWENAYANFNLKKVCLDISQKNETEGMRGIIFKASNTVNR